MAAALGTTLPLTVPSLAHHYSFNSNSSSFHVRYFLRSCVLVRAEKRLYIKFCNKTMLRYFSSLEVP